MSDGRAKYACDSCRVRKASCTREYSGCERCKSLDQACVYSRSGVLRRKRKQRNGNVDEPAPKRAEIVTRPEHTEDLTATNEQHRRLAGKDAHPHGALGALFEDYKAVWQDSGAFEALADDTCTVDADFEENEPEHWLEVLKNTLRHQRLPICEIPPDVLDTLSTPQRSQKCERAWLVMYYTVALKVVGSETATDLRLTQRVRGNLWLAFNDVRLLLEPKMSSLQALLLMATTLETCLTPSICWSLVAKACTMLQALGITGRHLDSETREQRTLLFWRLHVLDKTLSLILGRPPTLHPDIRSALVPPALEKLLPCGTHGSARLFEAHFANQSHLLADIMAEIWRCVYGLGASDVDATLAVKDRLEVWHKQAIEVLEAAALVEKPLLGPTQADAVDEGIRIIHFQYQYLIILLTRSCRPIRGQGTAPSYQLLMSLDSLSTATGQQYSLLIWQMLHYPFFVFISLFGEVLFTGKNGCEQSRKSLEAMRHLPIYLRRLTTRTPMAAKLAQVAGRVIEHVEEICQLESITSGSSGSGINVEPAARRTGSGLQTERQVSPKPMVTPASTLSTHNPPESDYATDFTFDSFLTWADDMSMLGTFDFVDWDNST